MFSGIVTGCTQILSCLRQQGIMTISIALPSLNPRAKIGDSIAINGTCLTITKLNNDIAYFDLIPKTLEQTNLNQLNIGTWVNIEPAMTYGQAVGGHLVQGHVDQTVAIISIKGTSQKTLIIECPKALSDQIVDKGYVTIDGMSLTVQHANQDFFSIALIPHTQSMTIAKSYKPGDLVNLEVDIMAKYIQQAMRTYHANH